MSSSKKTEVSGYSEQRASFEHEGRHRPVASAQSRAHAQPHSGSMATDLIPKASSSSAPKKNAIPVAKPSFPNLHARPVPPPELPSSVARPIPVPLGVESSFTQSRSRKSPLQKTKEVPTFAKAKPKPQTLTAASWTARWLTWGVDALLLSVLTMGVYALAKIVRGSDVEGTGPAYGFLDHLSEEINYTLSIDALPFMVAAGVCLGLSIALGAGLLDWTPGQKLGGARLVWLSPTEPTWQDRIKRVLWAFCSGGLLGLGFVWSLVDARMRSAHDILSGTDWAERV